MPIQQGGLFPVQNPIQTAMGGMQQAAGTLAQMQRKTGGGTTTQVTEGPGPSVGGAIGAGLGGLSTAASVAGALGGLGGTAGTIGAFAGGPVGLAIGAGLAMAGYLLG